MMPRVRLQMLVYNESFEDIDRVMRSLEAVRYPKESWHITLVSNAYPDHDTYGHLQRNWLPKAGETLPHLHLLRMDPNGGFAGGHQFAYKQTGDWDAEFVYLLNADGHLDPDALTNVVQYMQAHPNAAIVQSRVMLQKEPERLNSCGNCMHVLGFGFSDGYRQRPEDVDPRPHFYASGAGMLLRTSMIDAIGGLFDPFYFLYHEDVDVSWRARLAGYDIGYAEDSAMYHDYTFSSSIQKFFWMERNRHMTNLAHYKWPTLFLLFPLALVMEVGSMIFALKSGWGLGKLQSWLSFLTTPVWVWIWERRKLIRRIRCASDRELMNHMVGSITSQEVENPFVTHVVNPVSEAYFNIVKSLVRW